jgi:hypothetical protein
MRGSFGGVVEVGGRGGGELSRMCWLDVLIDMPVSSLGKLGELMGCCSCCSGPSAHSSEMQLFSLGLRPGFMQDWLS